MTMKKGLIPVFAMGGNLSSKGIRMRKKLFAGGNPDQNTSGDDPVDDGLTQGPGTGPGSFNWSATPSQATNPGLVPAGSPASPSFLQGAGRLASSLAPYMSNITNAFRTPPHPAAPAMVSPVTLSRIRLDATRQQASNASRAQDINADRSLDEQSAAAVRSSNLAKSLNQQGQISEQEAFLNARQKAEQAGMNLNVDAMNTGAINKQREEEVQRTIAMQREQSQNISNASDKYIAEGNERQKAAVDQQKLNTLSQIWKESGVYDRMIKKMKGQGNTDPTGINGQLGWLGDALGTDSKAAGGALLNPLVGKKPVRPALLSKPMTGPGKNSFKQVFPTGGTLTGPGGHPLDSTRVNDKLQNNEWAANGDSIENLDLYHNVNGAIGTGGNPMRTVFGKNLGNQTLQQGQNTGQIHNLMDAVSIYNQRPDVMAMSPEERVKQFYQMKGQNPDVEAFRTRGNALNIYSDYTHSTDQAMTSRAFGGYHNTIARGYLNPFGNTRSIGLGPGIPKDKFNPSHVSHQQYNLLAMGGTPKSDGASDMKYWTNYGDATPDLYEYGGIGGGYRMGGPFQEEWKHGGNLSHPRVVDHSMWKQPYKENALTNNDPNFGSAMAMGGEFSGEATAKDMSMWNRKVWSDAYANGGLTRQQFPDGGQVPPGKPLQVTNPNDPRLLRYNDSMTLYNHYQQFGKRLSDAQAHGAENNFAGNKDFLKWLVEDKDGAYKRLNDYNDRSPGRGDATQPATNLRTGDGEHDNTLVWNRIYDKPTQPVVYKKPADTPPAARSKVQGISATGKSTPTITANPPSSDLAVSQTPTKFSFTGRNDKGEQVSTYFPDLQSWKGFTDSVPWSHKEIMGNDQEAHATGVGSEFAGGGWISKAVNPAHKGFCTPMTKSTCTPRRKAFAMTMKKHHGFHAAGGRLIPCF